MASPQVLQVLFCRRLPGAVDALIFEMGFHLWLAQPMDVVTQFELEHGPHMAHSTRRLVCREQLSDGARRLVNFESYRDDILYQEPGVEIFCNGLARPVVWSGETLWMRAYRGHSEYWVLPDLPQPDEDWPDPDAWTRYPFDLPPHMEAFRHFDYEW